MTHHVIIPAAGMGRRMGADGDEPKCLRPVAGRPILVHALDALESRGMRRLTMVVGYRRQRLMAAIGSAHGRLRIDYVVNEDFADSEHGWSLYLAKQAWLAHRADVVFMDADNAFEPALLDRLLAAAPGNVVLVDPRLDTSRREDELVLGRNGYVTGFVRGHAHAHPDCVGGFVGMNRLGAAFMQALFDYMDDFFAAHGRGYKYERVLHRMRAATGARLRYLDTAGLGWVNVNHPDELALAERILSSRRAPPAGGRARRGRPPRTP